MTSTSRSGNRCGHDPNAPVWLIRNNPYEQETDTPVDEAGNNRRSRLQYKAIAAIKGYYTNVRLLPSLNIANGSMRQQRTERREACVRLLESMILHMDVTSLRIGYPDKNAFNGFAYRSVEFLADAAKLSYSRAKRALDDLRRAGILSSHQQYIKQGEGESTKYTGIASTKRLSEAFFTVLGFEKWLSKERKKASDRRKQRDDAFEQAVATAPRTRGNAALIIRSMINSLSDLPPNVSVLPDSPPPR